MRCCWAIINHQTKHVFLLTKHQPQSKHAPLLGNLVENAAATTQKPIVVFSMEMPAEQLVVRMMSSLGKIDQSRLRNGKLQQDDWPKLSAKGQLPNFTGIQTSKLPNSSTPRFEGVIQPSP